MIRVAADLHVHTCLSPCAERAMRPRAIVEAAVRRGIGMIGVCDHNSAANVRAVAETAGARLCVIAGMEITTNEEAHVIGLFPSAAEAEEAAREVAGSLREPLMLSVASAFSLEGTVDLVHRHGGLAIAAHVDRRSFSVPSQLGFIPPEAGFEALEISAHGARVGRAKAFADLGFTMTTGSDAHAPELVGEGFVLLDVEEPCFQELALALAGSAGRGCEIA